MYKSHIITDYYITKIQDILKEIADKDIKFTYLPNALISELVPLSKIPKTVHGEARYCNAIIEKLMEALDTLINTHILSKISTLNRKSLYRVSYALHNKWMVIYDTGHMSTQRQFFLRELVIMYPDLDADTYLYLFAKLVSPMFVLEKAKTIISRQKMLLNLMQDAADEAIKTNSVEYLKKGWYGESVDHPIDAKLSHLLVSARYCRAVKYGSPAKNLKMYKASEKKPNKECMMYYHYFINNIPNTVIRIS